MKLISVGNKVNYCKNFFFLFLTKGATRKLKLPVFKRQLNSFYFVLEGDERHGTALEIGKYIVCMYIKCTDTWDNKNKNLAFKSEERK